MESNHELDIKLNRIRQMLNNENLDACYIKRQDNFSWLTCGGVNYISLGDTGNCGLLITHAEQYAITNNIEAPRMISEENIAELGFKVLNDVWYHDNFEAETIREICGDSKVGCDYPCSLGENISSKIQPLRYSLTEEEVERYKIGGHLVSWAIEETAASIRPGDSEYEAAGRLDEIIRKSGIELVSVLCASDERIYQYRHPVPTSKKIQERVQIGGNMRYKGLTICCTRFVNFVPVTEKLQEQYKNNVEIDCTMIHNTIPGKSYQVPFLAAKKAYEERGYAEEFGKHHQGGPIGYAPRDFRVDFSKDGIIPENQAFCWNPSISGTKSEDTFIATSKGPVFITQPFIFPVIQVEVDGRVYKRANILKK